jgi:hypothetical protein
MKKMLLIGCITMASILGCSREAAPPEPMPLNQIGPALEKMVAKGTPESITAVSNVVVALKEKDNSEALLSLDSLSHQTTLTQKQRGVLARCRLTLINELNAAAEKGDERAASTLNYRRSTK